MEIVSELKRGGLLFRNCKEVSEFFADHRQPEIARRLILEQGTFKIPS